MKKATIADLAPAADYGRLMEAAAAYVRVERPKLSTPEAVYNFLAPFLAVAPDQEKFIVIYLNTKNRPIDAPQIVTTGLLDMSPVHPREVFRGAIVAGGGVGGVSVGEGGEGGYRYFCNRRKCLLRRPHVRGELERNEQQNKRRRNYE